MSIKCENWRYKSEAAKQCPFCGSNSVSVVHKEVRFLGQNYDGIKKLKMQAYCTCNKCHAKGKPIAYIGYIANHAFYDREHLPVYSCGEKAVDAWNERAQEQKGE